MTRKKITQGNGKKGIIKEVENEVILKMHTMRLCAPASIGPQIGKLPSTQHRGKRDLVMIHGARNIKRNLSFGKTIKIK